MLLKIKNIGKGQLTRIWIVYFYPSKFNDDRFKRIDEFPFRMLEKKYKYDSSVAMSYLNINYEFSLLEFKIYRPNVLTNNSVINQYWKYHCDDEGTFPNVFVKMKKNIKNRK